MWRRRDWALCTRVFLGRVLSQCLFQQLRNAAKFPGEEKEELNQRSSEARPTCCRVEPAKFSSSSARRRLDFDSDFASLVCTRLRF